MAERGEDVSDGFIVIEGFENMNFGDVTRMLAGAKWSVGISRAEVEQGARYSALVVGAFVGERQVGYVRVASDRTRFAYIMDMIVDEEFRHRGIGSAMVKRLMESPILKDVYSWMLTSNADGLYEKFGFKRVGADNRIMAIHYGRGNR